MWREERVKNGLTEDTNKFNMELFCEDRRRQFSEVLLEQRSDGVNIIVGISVQEIQIAFRVEPFFQGLDNNIGAAQSKDALFQLGILGSQVLETAKDNGG